MILLLMQSVERPEWYDWPWGAAAALTIIVGFFLWAIREVLDDYFITVKKFDERKKEIAATYATIEMLNGLGSRVNSVDSKVDGTVTLFLQTRERSDEAYDLARTAVSEIRRIDEKLGPDGAIQVQLKEIKDSLRNLANRRE